MLKNKISEIGWIGITGFFVFSALLVYYKIVVFWADYL